MDGDISVGHEQRAGAAGQTSALRSRTKGPRVHQQPLSFSALGQVPTTKGLIDGLGQRMKLRIFEISTYLKNTSTDHDCKAALLADQHCKIMI